jgi:hypothetical protein
LATFKGAKIKPDSSSFQQNTNDRFSEIYYFDFIWFCKSTKEGFVILVVLL